jgi:lantibiotic biosynthesis protein
MKVEIIPIIKEIAHRLRSPDLVKAHILDPCHQNPDPLYHEILWDDLSLAGGYTGIVLLLSELDRLYPNEKWDESVHAYVIKIKEAFEKTSFTELSLFSGIAGIGFALRSASREGTRYKKMIENLDHFLLQGVTKYYLTPLKANLENGRPSSQSLYELIQGIVGIGVYGLNNLHLPSFRNILEEILQLLIQLTKPIKIKDHWVPGWYIPRDYQLNEGYKTLYVQGNFNLGLSHGITGVLALLAISTLMGIAVEGQMEAMETMVEWLFKHRREGQKGYFWESMISLETELGINKTGDNVTYKDAWCYGTPGVARSLYLAGKAMKNESIQKRALESFCSVFQRSRKEWQLPGPSICHGISGLFMITTMMSRDSKDLFLEKKAQELQQMIIQSYRAEHPFGFKDLNPRKNGGFAEIDRVDLLEGTSGILLTLLSSEAPTSWWHAPFLISEQIN